jgi:hypothetical protein
MSMRLLSDVFPLCHVWLLTLCCLRPRGALCTLGFPSLWSSISVSERVRISDDLSVAMQSSLARAASARASVRLGSSISAFGRSCLVLYLIGFLPAPLSLNLIRSNLGLQPHFGFFFMSSSLALVTPASLDAACLRFMF